VSHGPYIYIDRRNVPGAGTRDGELVTLPPELRYVPPKDCYGYCDTTLERPTQVFQLCLLLGEAKGKIKEHQWVGGRGGGLKRVGEDLVS
jgi:hypothetical protein